MSTDNIYNEVYKYIISRLIQYLIQVIHFIYIIQKLYTSKLEKISRRVEMQGEKIITVKCSFQNSVLDILQLQYNFYFQIETAIDFSNKSLRKYGMFLSV